MKRFAAVVFAFVVVVPLVAGGVEVTVKSAVPLRDSTDTNKVIAEVPAGATFDALAVIPNWAVGTYRHKGVVLRGYIPQGAVLEQEKLGDLRERYRRRVAQRATRVDEMLALPDEKIDIGLGALLIGKEYDPSLDVPKYLAALDRMAREIRARPEWRLDQTNPRKLVEIVNDYLFRQQGYVALGEDESKDEHCFLHVLFDGKRASAPAFRPCTSPSRKG